MKQDSLIPLCDLATKELSAQLVNALRLGNWRKREDLARSLGVSARAIRMAASHTHGEVISGQRGLKLTACSTVEEVSQSTGRFRSQIQQMTRRVVEIEIAYHRRESKRA